MLRTREFELVFRIQSGTLSRHLVAKNTLSTIIIPLHKVSPKSYCPSKKFLKEICKKIVNKHSKWQRKRQEFSNHFIVPMKKRSKITMTISMGHCMIFPYHRLESHTQSKKISNDQELIQSDPTSCPQNQKGNN